MQLAPTPLFRSLTDETRPHPCRYQPTLLPTLVFGLNPPTPEECALPPLFDPSPFVS